MKQVVRTLVLVWIVASAGPEMLRAQFRTSSQPGVVETSRSQVRKSSDPGLHSWSLPGFRNSGFRYQMNHSFEMSMIGGGGQTMARNMYTNSQIFQFSPALSARVDVGVSMTPFSTGMPGLPAANNPQIFIRNASVDYRLSKNVSFHLNFSQDPLYQNVFGIPGQRLYTPAGF